MKFSIISNELLSIRRNIFLILAIIQLTGFRGYPEEKVRIACVGNSITYGARIENREQNSYPAQLASMLGRNFDVHNFGRSGATLLYKGDLPYWSTKEYKSALAFNPDLVFIKLGTNDTKPQNRIYLDDEFIKDYKDLITSFKKLPSNPRVVLLVPVPVFSTDTTGITSTVLTKKIIPMVRQVAYETNCEIVNLYNLFIESPGMFPDKVHPNAAGAKVIARRLYEFVKMKTESSFNLSGELPETTLFNFYGFQGYDFTFWGKDAKVVAPKETAPGHPWVWRARFWGHEPQTDIALLERGFHVAYCDVAELFGNNEALFIWNGFYEMLTNAGLAHKAVMEGMSRGGMYIYRWAEKYPERVSCIYADAPVLDMKSWPGGRGKSEKNDQNWEIFKKDFDFNTDEPAIAFKGNPLDFAGKIAKTGIPMLHVVGDADNVVPVSENTEPFAQKINDAGGFVKVIHKPGIGHHPHSLPNPQPIIDFILMANSLNNKPQAKTTNFKNDICLPSTLYMLSGTQNDIFVEPLVKRWRPYKDVVRFSGSATFQRRLHRVASITNPVDSARITLNLINLDNFDMIKSIHSKIVVGTKGIGDSTVVISIIGDSFTQGAFFKDALLTKNYVPKLQMIGLRDVIGYPGQFDEGRGGWTLGKYFSVTNKRTDAYNGFWQPTGNYRYWGATHFWILAGDIRKNPHKKWSFDEIYNAGRFQTCSLLFDETTGYKLNPSANDIMFDNSLNAYVKFNGKKWVRVDYDDFKWNFDYQKYLTMWNLKAPSILAEFLGLNDFRDAPIPSEIDFTKWNAQLEKLAASYLKAVPDGKFVVMIPSSTCGILDNTSGDFTTRQNACMWHVRRNIIEHFDNRENENIYIVDAGIAIDNYSGFRFTADSVYTKPYSDCTNTDKISVQTGNPHPYLNYPNMGISLAAFVQKYRNKR